MAEAGRVETDTPVDVHPRSVRTRRPAGTREGSIAGCSACVVMSAPEPEAREGRVDDLIGLDALHPYATHRLRGHRAARPADDLWEIQRVDQSAGDVHEIDPFQHRVEIGAGH